jgi:hypothetical protein
MTIEGLFNKKTGYLGRASLPNDDELKLELRLQIQGFKNFPAVYMACEFRCPYTTIPKD